MSYATGPIQSATQPAKDLMDTVTTTVDAHAAWEYVEEVAGSGTNVSRVFRNLGTANGFGTDFYIALTRTSLTSGVVMVAGENYNATTKAFVNPAVWFTTTPTALDADGSYTVDRHVANETTLTAATQGFMYGAGSLATNTYTGLLTNTTGFTYWLHVGPRYVVVATRVGTGNYAGYAGLYDSFHSTAVDPFPLFTGGLVSTGGNFQATAGIAGAYTRAGAATAVNYQFTGGIDRGPWTQLNANNATTTVTKEVISDRWFPSRVMLTENWRRNAMRGLLDQAVLIISMGENTEAMGDTVSVNGQLYTCLSTAPNLTTTAASLWVSQA